MPQTLHTTEQTDTTPSDVVLAGYRHDVDAAEERLLQARTDMADAMRRAIDGGVTMTHIAGVTGWTRQWCHTAIKRW